jgi:ribosomal protein L28
MITMELVYLRDIFGYGSEEKTLRDWQPQLQARTYFKLTNEGSLKVTDGARVISVTETSYAVSRS